MYYANVSFNIRQIIKVLKHESYQLLVMVILMFFIKSTFAIMMIKELMQNQDLQSPSLLGSILCNSFGSHLNLLQKTNSAKISIFKNLGLL